MLPSMLRHRGPARVFDDEAAAVEAIATDAIEPGCVVVIRYVGPKGGPACRRCSRQRRLWPAPVWTNRVAFGHRRPLQRVTRAPAWAMWFRKQRTAGP